MNISVMFSVSERRKVKKNKQTSVHENKTFIVIAVFFSLKLSAMFLSSGEVTSKDQASAH